MLSPHAAADAAIPSTYRIIERAQVCQSCYAIHKWTETFVISTIPAKLGMGSPVLRSQPITRPEWNLPIETVRGPTTQVPFCHSCVSPSLAHLPAPPPPPKTKLGKIMKDAPKAEKRPAPAVRHTAADLMDLIRKS